MTYTEEDYQEDRKLLDELNHRIDVAPGNAKPVFRASLGSMIACTATNAPTVLSTALRQGEPR